MIRLGWERPWEYCKIIILEIVKEASRWITLPSTATNSAYSHHQSQSQSYSHTYNVEDQYASRSDSDHGYAIMQGSSELMFGLGMVCCAGVAVYSKDKGLV